MTAALRKIGAEANPVGADKGALTAKLARAEGRMRSWSRVLEAVGEMQDAINFRIAAEDPTDIQLDGDARNFCELARALTDYLKAKKNMRRNNLMVMRARERALANEREAESHGANGSVEDNRESAAPLRAPSPRPRLIISGQDFIANFVPPRLLGRWRPTPTVRLLLHGASWKRC